MWLTETQTKRDVSTMLTKPNIYVLNIYITKERLVLLLIVNIVTTTHIIIVP